MRVADGEADREMRERVEQHVSGCERCRIEYESLMKLKNVTASMRLADLPDARWAGYWQDIYRRVERRSGWLLASAGALVLVLYGAYELFKTFLLNSEVPIVLRGGFGLLVIGVGILLVSIVRERLYARKVERYDKVEI
jgi:hypothetical protein